MQIIRAYIFLCLLVSTDTGRSVNEILCRRQLHSRFHFFFSFFLLVSIVVKYLHH